MIHWTTKPWGKLLILPTVIENGETHRLRIKRGGKSSVHSHQDKRNMFHVERGNIWVTEYVSGRVIVHDLKPGDTMVVESGVDHAFEAVCDSEVLEMYWLTDIHRRQAF